MVVNSTVQILVCLFWELQPPWAFNHQHLFLTVPSFPFPCRVLPPLTWGVYSEWCTPHSSVKGSVHHTSHTTLHDHLWCSCSPRIQLVPVHVSEVLFPKPGYLYSRALPQDFFFFFPNHCSSAKARKKISGHCLLRSKWDLFPIFHLAGDVLLAQEISFIIWWPYQQVMCFADFLLGEKPILF